MADEFKNNDFPLAKNAFVNKVFPGREIHAILFLSKFF